jgi:hypothetical protein
MMDLGERPFEGIGRAQFEVDSPDADFEPGGNFKKAQPARSFGQLILEIRTLGRCTLSSKRYLFG